MANVPLMIELRVRSCKLGKEFSKKHLETFEAIIFSEMQSNIPKSLFEV